MASDPFETVLDLEDTFYKEGHDLGVQDGQRTGLVEGRLFGLEKGFEKYATIGRFHGISTIWSARLSPAPRNPESDKVREDHGALPTNSLNRQSPAQDGERRNAPNVPVEVSTLLSRIPYNARLEKHIRTLYALTEPASLSTDNNEEAVSDFDDRLKRAKGKTKIIENLLGEEFTSNHSLATDNSLEMDFTNRSTQRAASP
ncbi:MAG: hypothetical protein Q9218_003531 [Villophora microphyllina]